MTDQNPGRLFKYSGFSDRLLHQLCMSQVYYADPATFNDPLDCQPILVSDVTGRELQGLLEQLVTRRVEKELAIAMKRLALQGPKALERRRALAQSEFDRIVERIEFESHNPELTDPEAWELSELSRSVEIELRRGYDRGVLCLSTKCDSPLMWSHYAQQHRGVCIEYDSSRLSKKRLRKVRYGESREVRASWVQRGLIEGDASACDEIERACLLTKSPEWVYEDEWRLLAGIGSWASPAPLVSVTFGLRCPMAVQYAIVAALGGAKTQIEFYEIQSPGPRFELRRVEVDTGELLVGMPRPGIDAMFPVVEYDADSESCPED